MRHAYVNVTLNDDGSVATPKGQPSDPAPATPAHTFAATVSDASDSGPPIAPKNRAALRVQHTLDKWGDTGENPYAFHQPRNVMPTAAAGPRRRNDERSPSPPVALASINASFESFESPGGARRSSAASSAYHTPAAGLPNTNTSTPHIRASTVSTPFSTPVGTAATTVLLAPPSDAPPARRPSRLSVSSRKEGGGGRAVSPVDPDRKTLPQAVGSAAAVTAAAVTPALPPRPPSYSVLQQQEVKTDTGKKKDGPYSFVTPSNRPLGEAQHVSSTAGAATTTEAAAVPAQHQAANARGSTGEGEPAPRSQSPAPPALPPRQPTEQDEKDSLFAQLMDMSIDRAAEDEETFDLDALEDEAEPDEAADLLLNTPAYITVESIDRRDDSVAGEDIYGESRPLSIDLAAHPAQNPPAVVASPSPAHDISALRAALAASLSGDAAASAAGYLEALPAGDPTLTVQDLARGYLETLPAGDPSLTTQDLALGYLDVAPEVAAAALAKLRGAGTTNGAGQSAAANGVMTDEIYGPVAVSVTPAGTATGLGPGFDDDIYGGAAQPVSPEREPSSHGNANANANAGVSEDDIYGSASPVQPATLAAAESRRRAFQRSPAVVLETDTESVSVPPPRPHSMATNAMHAVPPAASAPAAPAAPAAIPRRAPPPRPPRADEVNGVVVEEMRAAMDTDGNSTATPPPRPPRSAAGSTRHDAPLPAAVPVAGSKSVLQHDAQPPALPTKASATLVSGSGLAGATVSASAAPISTTQEDNTSDDENEPSSEPPPLPAKTTAQTAGTAIPAAVTAAESMPARPAVTAAALAAPGANVTVKAGTHAQISALLEEQRAAAEEIRAGREQSDSSDDEQGGYDML